MKLTTIKISLSLLALLNAIGLQAATVSWTGLGVDNNWSTPENWDATPGAADLVQWDNLSSDTTVNVDSPVTAGYFRLGQSNTGNVTFVGSSTTLDVSPGISSSWGLMNQSNSATTMDYANTFIVNNTLGTTTWIGSKNHDGNVVRFSGTLTLNTDLETRNSGTVHGGIEVNGIMDGAGALRINNTRGVVLGSGHDSSSGTGNIVLISTNRKLTVESGATVLSAGRKIQNNGTGAQLILNGENVINGANLVFASAKSMTIDVNANNTTFGDLQLGNSSLTLDLTGGNSIWFLDSSTYDWTGGSITITNFAEGLVRFGDGTGVGLTAAQLAVIDGGAYSLSSSGFITAVPEPSTCAIFTGLFALGLIAIRRRSRI